MDNDVVAFEDVIGFGLWEPETVSTGVQMDRGLQSEFAVTSVCDFVRPDKLSEVKESIET